MKVYPKIGDSAEELRVLGKYVTEGLEVQLLKEDCDIVSLVKESVAFCSSLKEVTIHTVLKYCFIENYLDHEAGRDYVSKLIADSKYLSESLGVRINILFHCRTRYDLLKRSGIVKHLVNINNSLEGTDVHLLIENDIVRVDDYVSLCYAYVLVKVLINLGCKHIKMCLDLCHLQSTLNLMKGERSQARGYFNNDSLKDIVHQVHFSVAKNKDGFIDKFTHSQPHTQEELESDIEWLKSLGLENTILVTEICEQDYIHKPVEVKELELLKANFGSAFSKGEE